ncbi:MAG: tetratricopeptide repeat protein [Armatimonadota bacterium]
MICTRCGTQNSESSKFCRECGKRLAIEGLNVEPESSEEQSQTPDEATASDLLYETLKLYESGMLESAFAKCKESLGVNPKSSSAHSLLALIYEKKADQQIEHGNKDDAEDCLRAAIRQVEWVLDANKDSVADRGKLEELCAKVDGLNEFAKTRHTPFLPQFLAYIRKLPTPWVAGAGTVIIIFVILVIIVLARGGSKGERLVKNPAPQQAASSNQLPAPYGQQYQSQTKSPSSSLPPAWSYDPQQSNTGTQEPRTTQGYNQQIQPSQPSALPSTVPALTPYPVTKPQSKSQPKQAQPSHSPAPASNRKPAESARTAYMRGDYQSAAELYQQTIANGEDTAENHQKLGMCYYNLAKKDAAITQFQRAVQLYMAQKAAGIDVDAANRAIETCKLYIDDLSRR